MSVCKITKSEKKLPNYNELLESWNNNSPFTRTICYISTGFSCYNTDNGYQVVAYMFGPKNLKSEVTMDIEDLSERNINQFLKAVYNSIKGLLTDLKAVA